jgi:hypothetical protein
MLGAIALVLLAVVAPGLLERGRDIPGALDFASNGNDTGLQSAAQISNSEFARVRTGFTPQALRSFVGEPASKTAVEVEGVELECWYYGVVGATGAYQLCFENRTLVTKLRYDRGQ